jgi:putative flippase GtrA
MELIARLDTRFRPLVIQFLKFGIVGLCGFFLDLALLHVFMDAFGFGHYASAFLSFPITVTFTWTGNRFFTFRGKSEGSAHAQWMRFFAVCGVGLVLNRGTYSLLTATVPLVYQYPSLGLVAGTAVSMCVNFVLIRTIVFR